MALKAAAVVAPAWTTDRAVERFLATRRRRASPAAAAFRLTGEGRLHDVDGTRIVSRSWGEGRPVLLLHGWNGSATDFRHLVPAITAAGFRAVALDAPGHGESDGDEASAVHLARALEVVGAHTGPAAAVVAHSLGGAAASLAVSRGLSTDRLVLLAPAALPGRYVERAAASLGASFGPRLVRALEARVGTPVRELDLERSLAAVDAPVWIVHDTSDRETPLAPVRPLVADHEGRHLLLTDLLGHRRVLADPFVVRTVASLVAGERVAPCAHGRVRGACASCGLSHLMYDRDRRAA
ncbi:MAG: alpha/beta fold hydrolase [Alphaproteobacteria bacterium]|nr:alpha/beta fold hydrolase [Alphaproteobacteria bacterium]